MHTKRLPPPGQRRIHAWTMIACCAVGYCSSASGQAPEVQPPPTEAKQAEDAAIELNLPPDVELKVLVEYVIQRLKVNILFDEQLANKKVTIRAPRKVDPSALMGILESALRMKGLVIVDAEQPGWKRIVQPRDLAEVADLQPPPPEGEGVTARATQVVTQVFELQHVDVKKIEQTVKPFLTQPGANTIAVPEQRVLIVTDYAGRMRRLTDLMAMLDKPAGEVEMRFVPVQHLAAGPLAQRVLQLLTARSRVHTSGGGSLGEAGSQIDVSSDDRTNQLILIGSPASVTSAMAIAASLDVALGLQTRVFQFATVSPERIDKLARELIDPIEADRLYRSTVDRDANLLIVTSTPQTLDQIEAMKTSLDVPVPERQSPVRFYKLMNTSAAGVLATIRAMEGGSDAGGLSGVTVKEPGPVDASTTATSVRDEEATRVTPPPYEDRFRGIRPMRSSDRHVPQGPQAVKTERATVVADENTNSLIVVAPPDVQQVYERLITMLDRRRPQVLIEATIVTLDTSNGFSLGVEISTSSGFSIGGKDGERLTFSSFGLSEVDEDSGRLKLVPGLGFNGAIISADIADVVVKALATSGKAKVMSAPKVLVNDNATGTISSINEAPYTSVNASDTVATTSFGGFVSAGTEISVTPHIAEGDHLRLEFAISLNSFGEGGSATTPPPRQTNAVQSEVTVPDGHTIIVGGVNRADESETVDAIPLLGEIPILKYLFSSRTIDKKNSTLFVFIRPVILRDDQFQDLRYYSARDVAVAKLKGDYPESLPMIAP